VRTDGTPPRDAPVPDLDHFRDYRLHRPCNASCAGAQTPPRTSVFSVGGLSSSPGATRFGGTDPAEAGGGNLTKPVRALVARARKVIWHPVSGAPDRFCGRCDHRPHTTKLYDRTKERLRRRWSGYAMGPLPDPPHRRSYTGGACTELQRRHNWRSVFSRWRYDRLARSRQILLPGLQQAVSPSSAQIVVARALRDDPVYYVVGPFPQD
jgi:hypothetical protein